MFYFIYVVGYFQIFLEMFYRVYKFFKFILGVILTLRRDIASLGLILKLKRRSIHYDKTEECVADVFTQWAKKQPNKPCIIFNDLTWTFKDVCSFFLVNSEEKTL
jgi:hypothetical protein